MKTAFIINAAAGRGRTAKVWPVLEQKIRESGFDFKTFFTPGPGRGGEIAAAVQKNGFSRLIAVGGDGTLHEVINAADLSRATVGILPTGTGNDLCRSLGIPVDPLKALEIILSGPVREIDLGSVNSVLFANVAGTGFDADVALQVNSSPLLSRLPGTAAYLCAVFYRLLHFQKYPVRVQVDGVHFAGKILFAAVGNGQYYGGGMQVVPQAQIDDSTLHLCVAGDVSLGDTIRTLPKIFTGDHIKHPKVWCLSGREIEIISDWRIPVHADGEIVTRTPALFTILPRRLKIIAPNS